MRARRWALAAAAAASAAVAAAYDVSAGSPLVTDARLAVADPAGSAAGLLARVLGPSYTAAFAFVVIPADAATGRDVWELDSAGGNTVVVRGNTGVAIANGLGSYLKAYCNASWTWGRNGTGWQMRTVPLPGALPLPAPTRTVAAVQWRYVYNVCTFSYTTPWWDAARWMEELDRLALWGVNLPLAFVGQEWLWLQLYTQAGLNASDVVEGFLAGPAFYAWQRMGNLQVWGTSTTAVHGGFIDAQRALAHSIVGRMRELGMTPVFPGFAGHVPNALQRRYPAANYTRSADWNGFNASFSDDLLLQPTDPLFSTLGMAFYENLVAEFGADPAGRMFFNADTYNEMDPASADPAYLRATNAAIYDAMASVVPNATFVMQGWLFVNSPGFWSAAAVEAFLSGVPDDRMLILDLFTESIPTWSKYQSFFGKPWIWNMLQVYGGRRALYGNLPSISTGPVLNSSANSPGSTMAGIGITPEATELSPVTFELMLEMGWRSEVPVLGDWVDDYVARRYGVSPQSPALLQAWATLSTTVFSKYYDYGTTTSFCVYQDEPQLTPQAGSAAIEPDAVVAAMRAFVAVAATDPRYDPATNPQFRYDLIDIVRQVACDVSHDLAVLRGAEYLRYMDGGENTTAAFTAMSAAFRSLLAATDELLGTDTNYLGLGHWLADATAWAPAGNRTVSDWLSFNARNQVTLWGPRGEINDYAAKNGWQGLVGDCECQPRAPVAAPRRDAPPHHPFLLTPLARGEQCGLMCALALPPRPRPPPPPPPPRRLRRALGPAHGHAGGGAGGGRAARLARVHAGAAGVGAGVGAQQLEHLPHGARGQHARRGARRGGLCRRRPRRVHAARRHGRAGRGGRRGSRHRMAPRPGRAARRVRRRPRLRGRVVGGRVQAQRRGEGGGAGHDAVGQEGGGVS